MTLRSEGLIRLRIGDGGGPDRHRYAAIVGLSRWLRQFGERDKRAGFDLQIQDENVRVLVESQRLSRYDGSRVKVDDGCKEEGMEVRNHVYSAEFWQLGHPPLGTIFHQEGNPQKERTILCLNSLKPLPSSTF